MIDQVLHSIKKHNLFQKGDRVLAAVSGGPDSVCMLHVLKELSAVLELQLFVFHLDHRIREEGSHEDAQFVKKMSAGMGIPSFILSFDVPRYRRISGISLQEAARRVRLKLLDRTAEKIQASKVALGHNSDDQVETILMRFLRGTGPQGLTGMSVADRFPVPGNSGASVVRPLLSVSRDEIENYCRENHLLYRKDPSNLKTVYLRNKVRLELLPYLEKNYNPQIRNNLLNMSRSLCRENDFIEQQAGLVFPKLLREESVNKVALCCPGLLNIHPALQRRAFREAFLRIRGNLTALEYKHLEAVVKLLHGGSSQGGLTLPGGVTVKKRYNCLYFLKGPEKKEKKSRDRAPIQVPGFTEITGMGQVIQAEIVDREKLPWPPDPKKEAYLDYDRITFPLYLSLRWPGARFRPLGLKGSKKLKDFFIDHKVPREERDKIPLIISGASILWVVGKQISHSYRLTDKTQRVLVLRVIQTQEE